MVMINSNPPKTNSLPPNFQPQTSRKTGLHTFNRASSYNNTTASNEKQEEVRSFALKAFLLIGGLGTLGIAGFVAYRLSHLMSETSSPIEINCMGNKISVNKEFRADEILTGVGFVNEITENNPYRYTGETVYKDNSYLCDGQGRFEDFNNGDVFAGDFKENGKYIKGTRTQQNVNSTGNFHDGKLNGDGEKYYRDGSIEKGNFTDNKKCTVGFFEQLANGTKQICDYTEKCILIKCENINTTQTT